MGQSWRCWFGETMIGIYHLKIKFISIKIFETLFLYVLYNYKYILIHIFQKILPFLI